jgi:hypothetical protein
MPGDATGAADAVMPGAFHLFRNLMPTTPVNSICPIRAIVRVESVLNG